VRPKDAAGKTRKRVALELVVDLERLYRRKKGANKELIGLVKATGTESPGLHGIGPSGAARLLVEVGDITRFPAKGHFASWTGTAPSTPPPAKTSGTGSPAAGTARSTRHCT
jgi:transposase